MNLGSDEVHVWYADPNAAVVPAVVERCHAILSASEQARCARFLMDRPRHEYLVAHALVRCALSRYAPVPPEAWRFTAGPAGKPEITGPDGLPPLRFNLSHTRGLCVCAVTLGRAVGIDVEAVDRTVSAALIASSLSAEETEAVNRVPEAARMAHFLDLWTLKEAYLKARGIGLTVPTSAVSFRIGPDLGARIAFGPEVTDEPTRWQFHRCRPRGHFVAVATACSPGQELVVRVNGVMDLGRVPGVRWRDPRLCDATPSG